ncbi:anti-sigma factor antagonist [Streptomyces aquilus]|uniref:Anti-sigma factor antagonist n=1 Tax=Streptomyces aquilus TaxID=2548456 RepID=A0A3S9I4C6_9ACTN|nr:STAS domain-containing protein [Streptomyces aquilus]AZP19219.1 anti-sigma factor antagonist [Streptomyces aquilus]
MPRDTTPATAPPPLRPVRVYRTRGHTVVELHGEIDIAAAVHITPVLDAVTDGPAPLVVIDLGPVEFLDCFGLTLLCRARRRVRERGGRLSLVCPQPGIRKILGIVGLTAAFAPATTLGEALARAGRRCGGRR